MKKVYIGIDESYDPNQLGYFVLNALLFKTEDDKIVIDNFIKKINIQKGYEEIKGSKISDNLKLKVIKKIKSLDKKQGRLFTGCLRYMKLEMILSLLILKIVI